MSIVRLIKEEMVIDIVLPLGSWLSAPTSQKGLLAKGSKIWQMK
jgi:hypothetical protein